MYYFAVFGLVILLSAETYSNGVPAFRIQLNGDEKNMIVNAINQARRNVTSASNMHKLVWDESLANQSFAQAHYCPYMHLNTQGFGGAYVTRLDKNGTVARLSATLSATTAMVKFTYVFRNNTCLGALALCELYKQLVKGESTKVGCAVLECRPAVTRSALCLLTPNQNKTIRPYSFGPKCSMCSANYSGCENGLCVVQTPQIMMNSTSTPNSTQMMMTPHKYRHPTPPAMITRPRNSSMAYTQTSVPYLTTSSVAIPSLYLPLALAPLMLLSVINACF
uniref:GLIPR1-like protein 1 n=1 Tax=Ciona intestinalis TaxID=7719 RepID=UPI00089DC7EC|nr:GLIPR1-like protein 1 [Ciona intestinalis]|eukprot:XP_018672845.1 GLIPR1-like protein 1 [Ciona intestinalis]